MIECKYFLQIILYLLPLQPRPSPMSTCRAMPHEPKGNPREEATSRPSPTQEYKVHIGDIRQNSRIWQLYSIIDRGCKFPKRRKYPFHLQGCQKPLDEFIKKKPLDENSLCFITCFKCQTRHFIFVATPSVNGYLAQTILEELHKTIFWS